MIRCLKLGSDALHTNVVSVYSADTDVFFLLLSHSNQLNCSSLYIRLVKGFVDIKLLHSILGDVTSKALLSLHALTGSDTTGKFDGKSKQFWFRRFLTIDQNDLKLKEELVNFQTSKKCTEVLSADAICTDLTRIPLENFEKLFLGVMRGIHCSQREDSREKSCLPPRMHLDFIFPERSSSYQYGAQHAMPLLITLTLCMMDGNWRMIY